MRSVGDWCFEHVEDLLGRSVDAIRTGCHATDGFFAAAGPVGHVREAVIARVQAQAVSRDVGNRLGFKLCELAATGERCGWIVEQGVALLDRISVDGATAGGRPTIRGHRIWVSLVLGLLADGMSAAEILADYPGLDEADIRACIAYGAWLASGHFTDVA